jgi:hypothetical protein
MTDSGEEGEDVKTPLVRLESVTSKRVKSSKADEGLGEDSWEPGERNDDVGDLKDLIIATKAVDWGSKLTFPQNRPENGVGVLRSSPASRILNGGMCDRPRDFNAFPDSSWLVLQ